LRDDFPIGELLKMVEAKKEAIKKVA